MTFNENDVNREHDGKFGSKTGAAPEVALEEELPSNWDEMLAASARAAALTGSRRREVTDSDMALVKEAAAYVERVSRHRDKAKHEPLLEAANPSITDRDGRVITVGTPATIGIGSDSYPATVVGISKSGRTIEVQNDNYQRTDSNGYGGNQEYSYAPNPDAPIHKYSLRKDGRFRLVGSNWGGIGFGERRAYQDPSF